MKLELEAADYLKERSEYKRIINEIQKNYKRLGKLSGTIKMKDLSEKEGEILAQIDHKFYNTENANFSVKKFIESFCVGKFKDLDFLEILNLYSGRKLISNKDKKELEEKEKMDFFQSIIDNFKNTDGSKWLEFSLKNKTLGYITLVTNYNKSLQEKEIDEYKIKIKILLKAINNLAYNPEKAESIPMFSSRNSKDPHFFDLDRYTGKLLLNAICFKLNKPYVDDVEGQAEILYGGGILKDEISSSTATYGLRAYRCGEELKYINAFTKDNQPLVLTLGNITNIDYFKCNNNKLFIFENPSVFAEVIKRIGYLNPTMICTSGQLKLSSLILLDKIVNNADEIYYSGDFDPEGICIADKLKQRYQRKLKLWRFTQKDYEKVKSESQISQKRITILSNIKNSELIKLSETLIKNGFSGYQELLIDEYIEDIIIE